MKRTILSLTTLATSILALGQAQIVINNAGGSVYMVFNNPAVASLANQTWLVIDHAATTGFAALPNATTSAGVRSEDEYNMIRWRIGTTLGTYVVPYNSPLAGVNMPLTYQKTSAGTGAAASVVFSSYNFGSTGAQWDNYIYRPSDVTHVSDDPTGTSLNSGAPSAVDRFWVIDTQNPTYGYTANPAATLTFTSVDAEITTPGVGNTFTSADPLAAQRFNNSNNHWADYFPGGAWAVGAVPTTHTVNVAVPAAQWFRSWTLSDLDSPLPVELTSFAGNCVESRVELTWSTASETDNSYFEVEKSSDGIDWTVIGTVNGAGNSVETINYTYMDATADGSVAYYRLNQVDMNGSGTLSSVVTAGCSVTNGTELVNVWDNGAEVQLMVTSTIEGVFDVSLMDTHSKAITTLRNQNINKGVTYLNIPKNGIATGMYMVRMFNQAEQFSRKVVLN